jgi:hypothetical protein
VRAVTPAGAIAHNVDGLPGSTEGHFSCGLLQGPQIVGGNMIIYWLVLIYSFTTGTNAATSSMLHVGNFKDLKECQAAGTAAGGRDVLFVCIQANDTGANPPP